VARTPAAAEVRNWRRFIALPRLDEKKGLDAQINLTEHILTMSARQAKSEGTSVHICLRAV
jgi:hypothetical protein